MTLKKRLLKIHPATLIFLSFLLAILFGALLLKLPFANKSGYISFIDAFFTATSAVCVTGLVVVDTGGNFTLFGQGVILLLIQIGGLGVMTISVLLFRLIGRSISFRQRMAMQDLFAHTPRKDIFHLLKSIAVFTICAETVGMVLLTLRWQKDFPLPVALFTALFHSVSAFCNAGFSLFSDSLVRYRYDPFVNLTVCALIVIGGIGFPVLYDIQGWISRYGKERVRLSIQTKTVLITTIALIVWGTVMFWSLERASIGQDYSLDHLLLPLFQSITCRTAGFNTIDIASLREATLAMMIFLMFFGASPGSCGGGVKTTTLALLTTFTISRVRRQRRVNMFKKSIPVETVTRSFSLILISIGIISTVVFMLLLGHGNNNYGATHPHNAFLAYCFETVSAFGTVGLSMGITPLLNAWGKCWIIVTMIIGRVGVLAFSYIIVGTGGSYGVEYAEENLMIG